MSATDNVANSRRGHTHLTELVPGYDPAQATAHEHIRAVAHAVTVLGACLRTVPAPAA